MSPPLLSRNLIALAVLTVMAITFRASSARAAPPRGPTAEELVADGEVDAEDLVGRATVGRALLPRALGGAAWVSLAGFTRTVDQGQRDVGGMVVVGLPLDRMARVATRASVRADAQVRATASAGADVVAAAGAMNVEGSEVIGVTPRVARAAVEAAWRAGGLGIDDARLEGILSRARWSAVLPETRLRATRFDDQRLSTDATADTSRLRDTASANVGLEARLTWRLDRLLYADDEPSFERMRLERHDARSRVAGRVLEALFHWHRAWLELRWTQAAAREAREPPNRPSRDELEAAMRLMEAEATLDVLTAGWFTSRSRVVLVKPVAPSAAPGPPRDVRDVPEAL